MSSETNTYPIYLSLIEQRGEKTDRIIKEIKELSQRFDIYEEVTLSRITPATRSGPEDNTLIYQIDISTTSNKKAQDLISFLEYIFQKMFDKYPALVEPPA